MRNERKITCKYCGKIKNVRDKHVAKRQKFCSVSCSQKHRFEQGYQVRPKSIIKYKKCQYCEKKFPYTYKMREQKFCSHVCYGKSRIDIKLDKPRRGGRTEHICLWCEKKREIPINIAKTRKFCSRECYRRFMRSESNEFSNAHPFYLSSEWRQIRNRIRERDQNRCIHCENSTSLIVHHIQSRSKWGNPIGFHPIADADENLETVCAFCHWKLHLKLKSVTP